MSRPPLKKSKRKATDELRSEYDLRQLLKRSVRGKYAKRYKAGTTAIAEDQADLVIAQQRVRERPMKTLAQYLADRSPSVRRTRTR